MFKKLDFIEALVFVIAGIIIDVVAITQQSGLASIVVGALLIVAGILHFMINVRNK